jgi:hypothetical protein
MTKSQKDKYLKFNDAIDLVADATQQKMNLYVGISSGNVLTLGDEDFTENFVFHCRDEPGSPTLDGEWVLRVPATMRNFAVMNDTSFQMYVESAGSPGSLVEIVKGGRAHLHSDGDSIEELKRDIYDLFAFVNVVTFGARIAGFESVRPWKLPANLPGSAGYAWVPSGASENDRVVSIQKDESEIGTMTFAPLASSATISFASDVTFAPGERFLLRWASEESPDVAITLADVALSIKGVAT